MGGGTDVALETADAAVMHGRVSDVAAMVDVSKRTMTNIRQNIAVALGLKAIFLVTTIVGLTGLWPAILADTGATVLVTMNALRLLRLPDQSFECRGTRALSLISIITRGARYALPKLTIAALMFGLTTGATIAFAPTGDGGGTTRFDVALLVRIGVAVALAFPIGWEREFRGAEAGDRTFMLVSLGAAAFTAVGVENFPATAGKVMPVVVTGVGFLGGGMILRDGGAIRGLTTAAAIWSTAAVGMLAGVGELLIAVTGMVILILEFEFPASNWPARRPPLAEEDQVGRKSLPEF